MDKLQALGAIDARQDQIIDVNDRIWEYAETAFTEFQSAKILEDALRDNGFAVESGIAGIPTAFLGRYGSGRPVVGILGEFDALSGLNQAGGVPVRDPIPGNGNGHGCGHNCLGAASLAAAIAVKTYLENNPGKSGTVIYYGCPGEEGGSGKAFMAREGVFDELDCAICWHPESYHGIMTGSSLANYQIAYHFKGIASHAAGDPHLGRSALDAVALMNLGVQFLREHVVDAARIHYAITNSGGYSPNVVQPTADVLYLIRAPKVQEVAELYERVNNIARGAALMTGTEVEIEFIKACSNVVINKTMEEVLYRNMALVGAPTYTDAERALCAKVVDSFENPSPEPGGVIAQLSPEIHAILAANLKAKRPIHEELLPFFSSDVCIPESGSTDVGDVSWVVPTSQIYAVTIAAGTPGHSWQFTATGNTSIAHKGVLFAGKSMAGAAIDFIDNPEIVDAAKAEHRKRLGGAVYQCPIPAGVKPKALGLNM